MAYSDNALKVYKRLYFLKDLDDNYIETNPSQVHKRVVDYIIDNKNIRDSYYKLFNKQIFRPNTPCLINAGINYKNNHNSNLCACFVLGLEDSMESITDMFKTVSLIYSSGAGAGMEISKLREKNAPLSTGGKASGPISFMNVIETLSNVVKSGGRNRRAANLISLKYNHPDIIEFINCKQESKLHTMNISIVLDNEFFEKLDSDSNIELVSPNNNITIGTIKASEIWDNIIDAAWKTGDPGLLFYDNTNLKNKSPSNGDITATNPCLPIWGYVKTPDGYQTLQNVKYKIYIDGETKSCSEIYKTNPYKSIYEITLDSGLKFHLTDNHKVTTTLGDIPVVDLVCNRDKVKVDYSSINTNMDWDEFRYGFIGGCIYLFGRIFLNSEYKEIIFAMKDDISKEFIDYFENNLQCQYNEYRNIYTITDEASVINTIVDSFGVINSSSFSCIRNRSISYQLGILSSVISYCGKVENNIININRSYSDSKLFDEMILILNSIGIYSKIETSLDDLTLNLKIYDIDAINKKLSIIGNDEIQDTISNPDNIASIRNEMEFQTVKDIRHISTEAVFDITVPDGNHFVTGGAIVHNCGEVPLIEWSTCNLGSINLNKVLDHTEINYDKLKDYVEQSILFLDSVIDKTTYINNKFKDNMLKFRPIGLGIMGFADILYKLNIPYDSDDAMDLLESISKFITKTAYEYSIERVATDIECDPCDLPKSDYINFSKLLYSYGVDEHYIDSFLSYGIRNTEVTCYAPTGSISISADCSYSFEPIFALVWTKTLTDTNDELYFINEYFESNVIPKILESNKSITKDKLLTDISNNKGSIQNIDYIDDDIKKVFKVAHDIDPNKRIEIQGKAQQYVTMAISSTVNLPSTATKNDVANIYRLAHKVGLKGITIYRDGCLDIQPVSFGKKEDKKKTINNISDFERPILRPGKTIEVKTPAGKLFLTGNSFSNDNLINEIFIRLSKQGTLVSVLVDALARSISKGLQHGVDINEYIDTLIDIQGESFWANIGNGKTEMLSSIPDLIAKLLQVYFTNNSSDLSDELKSCPSCGNLGIKPGLNGCKSGSCIFCGYSACSG